MWVNGEEVSRVPFVATEDRRGSERLGWELQVLQPNQLADASGHELMGATITLSGLRYVNATAATPIVNQNEIVLGAAAQTLATADAAQGSGAWALALGQSNGEGHTDGVVLRIPANTTANNTEYSTAIVLGAGCGSDYRNRWINHPKFFWINLKGKARSNEKKCPYHHSKFTRYRALASLDNPICGNR